MRLQNKDNGDRIVLDCLDYQKEEAKMQTEDYCRENNNEKIQDEQEQKPKPMQPFKLDGEMTVILPNGMKIEISSKNQEQPIVVSIEKPTKVDFEKGCIVISEDIIPG